MQVVFVYKPGGVLITSDLFWNYPRQGTSTGTKLWKFGMDRVYAPFYRNFMIKDKGRARSSLSSCHDGVTSCFFVTDDNNSTAGEALEVRER